MKYSNEQRIEALKLIEKIGVDATSARTGIKKKTLYSWRDRQKKKDTIFGENDEPLTPEQMAERIRNLEKELEQTQKDNQILMDALDFFARNRRK